MKKDFLEEDTIIAIATPQGAGAIGVVRLSGGHAVQLAESLISLSHSGPFASLPSQKCVKGILHQNGTHIDQVLVTLFRAPHSYTGEDVVEISCHGGSAVLKEALNIFLRSGARMAGPGEFSQRAFLNGKMDLTQAEAVADLIRAQTELSRQVALSQLEGALSGEVGSIKDTLTEICAHIEIGIDHSDDSTVGALWGMDEIGKKLDGIISKVRRLIQSYEFGRIAREGARIAIIGKPNVGKSSLLNRLLKSDRAIVTTVPGTTRDTIEEGFELFGLPAVLVDTAGIREKISDSVEEIGIERTRNAIASSDGIILMLDSSRPVSSEDRKIAALISGKKKVVIALNKSDLPVHIDPAEVKKIFPEIPALSISTLRNAGIEEFLELLYRTMCASSSQAGLKEGEVLVTSLRQMDALRRAEKSLLNARPLCRESGMDECLALEIREALSACGEIVGAVVTEDILNELFSKFCVGK